MLLRSILIILALLFSVLFIAVPKSLAVNNPSFPSCLNPQGETKVVYESGTHGIPGDSATYSGKDTVYKLSDETLTQCFCSANGDGIQTNWWKVSSLSDDEVETLRSQGWNYIPNGSLWGLENAPYLAKNDRYSCAGGGIGGGDVLVASTTAGKAVLGLATTGNALYIVSVISSGLLLLAAGSILSIKMKK